MNKVIYFDKVAAIEDCHGNRAYIDKEDVEKVLKYTFCKHKDGYFRTMVNRKTFCLHNVILPSDDKSLVVDHINKCKLDNKKCNLRLITRRENSLNRKASSKNKSGITGVHYDKYTRMYVGRYSKFVRKFKRIEDAINFRNEMEYLYGA